MLKVYINSSENVSVGKFIHQKIWPSENVVVGKFAVGKYVRKICRRKNCVGKFAVGKFADGKISGYQINHLFSQTLQCSSIILFSSNYLSINKSSGRHYLFFCHIYIYFFYSLSFSLYVCIYSCTLNNTSRINYLTNYTLHTDIYDTPSVCIYIFIHISIYLCQTN